MQIDLVKLINDLLPISLRKTVIVRLLFLLIQQARTAFDSFMMNIDDWKYRARANASVLSLQNAIGRNLDVEAVITELNGKPIDFLVTVTGPADETQLRALIDSQKLAGKSYVFVTGDTRYTAEWSNYVCEEEFIYNRISGDLGTSSMTSVDVSAEFPVTSQIVVTVRAFAGTRSVVRSGNIPIGETNVVINTPIIDAESGLMLVIDSFEFVSVTPLSDETYIYQLIS